MTEEIVCCSRDSQLATMGILQIWTHKAYRRNGFATKLIHVARENYVFGYIIPMKLVAFTQPTPSGKKLAEKVCGEDSLLVYSI